MVSEQYDMAHGILLTDQYQLTMAQLYYDVGLHEMPARFEHFFRSYPDYGSHKAGYCVNAGLAWLLDWMQGARFGEQELDYLRQQTGSTGGRVFSDSFLDWLGENGSFHGLTLSAIPEGRVVHPNVPLTVVEGPLAMIQILETALLNHLNFQTLVATKAARVSASGRNGPLLEFGLRRAQGPAAMPGARAALIGGADFSSNVAVSRMLGLPPKGTHAHSMVQVFMSLGEGELEAFRAYADLYPDDCLLLVDTIDTLQSGIPNAIKVFEELRSHGHQPVGIRLDSGDLAHLSVKAAQMLNAAGFPDTSIVLSSDLDELVIWQILTQIQEEAPRYGLDADHVIDRLVYGVGTRLITSAGDAALDGVYKLVAVRKDDKWLPAIKISDTEAKTPNPARKKVWRLYDQRNKAVADLLTLFDEQPHEMSRIVLRHPSDHTKHRVIRRQDLREIEPLLVDVWDHGKRLVESEDLDLLRQRRRQDIERLDSGVRRLVNPHVYHVSLSARLWDTKQDLIASAEEGQLS